MLSQFQDYLSLDAKQVISSQLFWYGLAIVFFLLSLWKLIRSSQPKLVAVFTDDEGTVKITPQALRSSFESLVLTFQAFILHPPKYLLSQIKLDSSSN